MKLTKDICFNGEMITTDYIEDKKERQVWNREIKNYPIAILYCTSKEEVVSALKSCIKNNINFRIRYSGHNYEGYSTDNNAIVIDISRMKEIIINELDNTVKIETGVQNSELYEYLGEKGYPFPGGTCPTAGVVGDILCGGWGLSSRLFGLGADNAVEFELVDHKGNLIIANRECNSDLFWALRGGIGGNFGIVTSIIFRLPPKFNNVTLFTIHYPKNSLLEQSDIMDAFQNLYETLDRRVNMRASFYNSEEEGIASFIIGLFYGEVEELREILEPLLILPKAYPYFEYTTFINAINKVVELYPDNEKFKSTGRFVNRIYSKYELLKLAALIQQRPKGSVLAAITFYGLGGAVKDTGKYETAFYYRDSKYIIGVQSVWEESIYAEENKEWMKNKLNFIETITKGSYMNFPYNPLMNYEKQYYGGNLCRLRYIKEKYDPCNIFNYPQEIK